MEEDSFDRIEHFNHEELFGEDYFDQLDYKPCEKHFDQYNKKPFLSFINADLCDEESEEQIFDQFKQWLLTYRTEGFLYTFEPKPTLANLSLGKCPYFHTGLTSQERIDEMKRMMQEEKIKKDLEEFLRIRLRLVQRLLIVYKRAKRGIEEEFFKNHSRKDPLCDCKKKIATKRIVDMMIKQFALEYLYFKSMKIKKEIEVINCILIDTDRLKHLKNIHKYTLKTAEKLRCLLERECCEDNSKCEKFFEDNTLKDMARMYLNEIENLAASVPYFSSQEWSREYFWEGSSSSEGGIPDYECLSDLIESSFLHEEAPKETDAASEELSITLDGTSEKQDEEESKLAQEEENILSSKKGDKILEMGEEDFRPLLQPEESHNIIDEIKKEILKPDYSLVGEASKILVPEAEEKHEEEDIRLAQLEINRAEIEMLEEFKRELWLIDSFYYFMNKVRPELSGKFNLVHVKSIFEESETNDEVEETVTTEKESSIDSDLNRCLTYLNPEYAHKKESGRFSESSGGGLLLQQDMQATDLYNQNYQDENDLTELSLLSEETYINENIRSDLVERRESEENEVKQKSSEEDTIDPETLQNEVHRTSEEGKKESVSHNILSFTESQLFRDPSLQLDIPTVDSESSERLNIKTPSPSDVISLSRLQKISFESSRTCKINSDFETISHSSRRSSIPSHAGSLPDPFKIYKKCLQEREIGIDDDDETSNNLLGSIITEDLQIEHSISAEDSEDHLSIVKSEVPDKLNKESSRSSKDMFPDSRRKPLENVFVNGDDEQSDEANQSKCFPTLYEIMDHFTKAIKGHSISLCDDITQEEEVEEEVEEEEPKIEWDELMNIKWKSPVEKRMKPEFHCEFDSTDFIEQLQKSNKHYMRNHPEMSAMISLILRAFSLKKPQNEFVTFIRDVVFNRYFAKDLSCYLAVNNKAYQRRNFGGDDSCTHGLKTVAPNMFSFDKLSSEYWREWGVDYKRIYEKYGPTREKDICPSGDAEADDDIPLNRDAWDLRAMLDAFNIERKSKDKSLDQSGGWAKFIKTAVKEEVKDLKNENTCVNALADEVDWELPKDLRSSCQKMFLKRYIVNRKKN